MSHPDSRRASLLEAGAQLARADADRQAALVRLTLLAEAAVGEEMSISEISRLSGVSRPTLYALLAKAAPDA